MALDGWPRVRPGPNEGAELRQRNQLILAAVATGQFDHSWCPLTLSDGENTLEIQVSCDALKIDGVRVEMDAETQQTIGDILIALLLTPKLVDRIYKQTDPSNRLDPKTHWPNDSSTDLNIEMSARIDAEIAKRGASGLLANVGKDWVLVRKIFTPQARAAKKAANYGLLVTTDPWQGINTEPTVSLPGVFAIQGVGTVHNSRHADYSQISRFALRAAKLNGNDVDLGDVYTGVHGDAVARLVSSEGPLPGIRQGGEAATPTIPPAMALVPPASKTQKPPPKKPPVVGVTTSAAMKAEQNHTKGAILGAALGGIAGALLKTTATAWVGAAIGGGLGWFLAPKKTVVPASWVPEEAGAAGTWPEKGFYVERWAWRGDWALDCIGSEKDCTKTPDPAVFWAWHDLTLHEEPGTGVKQWVDHGWLYSWSS